MKKLKLKITFVFLLGMFLSACGGGGGGGGSSAENNPEANSSEEITVGDSLVFFKAKISPDIIQSKCIACHVDGYSGTDGTNLKYVSSSVDGHEETNYQTLLSYLQSDAGNSEKMLSKVTGDGHGGGKQLDSGSSDYKNLEAFILAVKDLPITQSNRVIAADKLESDLTTADFAGDTNALIDSVLTTTTGLGDFISIIPAAFDGAYDAIQNDPSLDNDQKAAALEVIVKSLLSNIDDTTSLRTLRSFTRKAEFTEDFSLLLQNLTRNIVKKVGTSASVLQSLTKTVIHVLPATGLVASEIEGTFISLVVETLTDEVMDRNEDSNHRDSLLESLSLGVEEGATLIDEFAINVGNITTITTELIRDKAKAKDKNYDTSNLEEKISQNSGICSFDEKFVGNGKSVTAYLSEVATPGSCEQETRTCSNGNLSRTYDYSSCSDPETYFANKISPEIIQAKCIACHVAGGLASSTTLSYQQESTAGHLDANYQTLISYLSADSSNKAKILEKAVGINHLGGEQISDDSEAYFQLSAFLNSIEIEEAQANCELAGQSVMHGEEITAYSSDSVPYGSACVFETRSCENGVLSGSYGFKSCLVSVGNSCLLEGQTIDSGSSITAYLSEIATLDSCEEETRTCTNGTLSGTYEYSSCSDPVAYFASDISPDIIQGKCIVCHVNGGLAAATPLRYVSTSTSGHLNTNYETISDYIESNSSNADLLLQKSIGASGHGGGAILSANSEEYTKLKAFVESLGAQVSQVDPLTTGRFWDGVEETTPEQTLRRAGLIVARRMPTDQEIAEVKNGGEAALHSVLRGLMQGDGFHQFLLTGSNDRLHFGAFLDGLSFDGVDLNRPYFPIGANKRYESRIAAPDEWPKWERYWQWGMAISPLELIAYIVENDRSYQEVVTADYMMVSPIVDEILRSNTGLTSEDSHLEYRPGKNQGQVVQDEFVKSEFFQDIGLKVDSWGDYIDYPHAGLLSSLAFLSRYPTTETNRNRARSRWTYYHFLGLDIEKSASRTTDPVALADTNNPTMNNPACTVCHQTMDPVAGAFEDFGNEGWYRDQWGGKDSLPHTYKYSDDSPYQNGDTWFRDMRVPGFNGMIASGGSSIQWLGRRIAEDSRFATAAIKFWWPAIMGEEVKRAPESSGDVDYQIKLAAFTEQNDFIEELGQQFAQGFGDGQPFNAKDLFVEMMMSPWFRASTGISTSVAYPASDIGSRRLLTPEELAAKTESLLGWEWGQREEPDQWQYDEQWTQLGDRYRISYGGIDSNGIKERSRALTSLMSNVAEKQAVEMACPAVVMDFAKTDGQRNLFNGIDRNTTPNSKAGEVYTIETKAFDESFTVEKHGENNPATFRYNGVLAPGNNSVKVEFLNDWADPVEGDRNLHVVSISVKDSNQQSILYLDRDHLVEGIETFTCGSSIPGQLSLYCGDGYVWVPFQVNEPGTYNVEIEVWGEQAGPDLIRMSSTVQNVSYRETASRGEVLLKEKLVELHQKFLGEKLSIDDEEITYSYRLLLETWEERQTHENNGWAWHWPNEDCWINLNAWRGQDGANGRANDPNQMLYTWASVLIYLMTDFYYLHE